ncbi:helix-turn-helix domain-containing protein [Demequina capsici]|uniref:Helix-turn-helix domain-containing protein n=1 Tax=Demequina capsici TaxID=3075620 RepID=A0AA96JHC3_9MICO|nr:MULTISPECIES: helix-turn-helix domain-containing protein [unclassified Demequina]WNM25983.1 helix-turn-helix domain-containing protein [Demequina sp. OYTSA14]WNM28859.1 helix-turn-helix domain-containing protein [Demequina sp. PMTSA13]
MTRAGAITHGAESAPSGRAPRMAPDDRRAHILDAAIPLILERGAEVTTREIAEAAGVAEGTIFRVFDDKDSLIDAAVLRVVDPASTLAVMGAIDPEAPLDVKVAQVVTLLHERVTRVVAFMTALGPRDHARQHGHPEAKGPLGEATGVVEALLAPHAHQLRVDPATAVDYLRILVFGTSMPFIRSSREITADELTDFILRGISREGD